MQSARDRRESDLSHNGASRRSRLVLFALLAVAVMLRVGYFVQLDSGPCIDQHRWAESDMQFFDEWASQLAADDPLTLNGLHPYHSWHQRVARRFLAADPQAAASFPDQARIRNLGPERAVWDLWYGDKRFHQSPLYPYLLAITYKLAGHDVRWVFGWQMVLGLLNILLVHAISRRLFGDLAAAIAAAMATLCGVLIFYEMVLLRATLLAFAALLLVWLVSLALEQKTVGGWFQVGLAGGLAFALKSIFAPFLLCVLAVLAIHHRRNPRRLVQVAGALVGGVLLCLLPFIARNLVVGAPALGFTSVGAMGVILGMAADSGTEIGRFVLPASTATIMGHAEGRLLPVIVETLRTHDGPLGFFVHVGRKLLNVWHWYEVPNNANLYYYRLHASVLRLAPVGFWLIASLALIGVARVRRALADRWPLYAMQLSVLAPLVFFGQPSRFRLPLLALLLPLAGWTVARLVVAGRARRWGPVAGTVAAVAVLLVFIGRPLPVGVEPIRYSDRVAPHEFHYRVLEHEATQAGDWAAAADVLAEALRFEPDSVRQLGAGRPPTTGSERRLGGFYSGVRMRYAGCLARAGRTEEAEAQRTRALELSEVVRPAR